MIEHDLRWAVGGWLQLSTAETWHNPSPAVHVVVNRRILEALSHVVRDKTPLRPYVTAIVVQVILIPIKHSAATAATTGNCVVLDQNWRRHNFIVPVLWY